jgi:hypothetical protein
MDNLHREIILATAALRKRLADADIGGSFGLTINISGRIQDGDVLCEYRLCKNYGSDTKGHSLTPVINEFLRRNGWEETNAPLALPAPSDMYKSLEPVAPVITIDNDPQPDVEVQQY